MLDTLFAETKSKLQRFVAGPIAPAAPQRLIVPDDLIVHANGATYDLSGNLDTLSFDLSEQLDDGPRRYIKVMRLVMLTYLPSREREQSTVLLEMQKMLKAVNTALIDLICLSANILDPDIGVVQIYGAAGMSPLPARATAHPDGAPGTQSCAESIED